MIASKCYLIARDGSDHGIVTLTVDRNSGRKKTVWKGIVDGREQIFPRLRDLQDYASKHGISITRKTKF